MVTVKAKQDCTIARYGFRYEFKKDVEQEVEDEHLNILLDTGLISQTKTKKEENK